MILNPETILEHLNALSITIINEPNEKLCFDSQNLLPVVGKLFIKGDVVFRFVADKDRWMIRGQMPLSVLLEIITDSICQNHIQAMIGYDEVDMMGEPAFGDHWDWYKVSVPYKKSEKNIRLLLETQTEVTEQMNYFITSYAALARFVDILRERGIVDEVL